MCPKKPWDLNDEARMNQIVNLRCSKPWPNLPQSHADTSTKTWHFLHQIHPSLTLRFFWPNLLHPHANGGLSSGKCPRVMRCRNVVGPKNLIMVVTVNCLKARDIVWYSLCTPALHRFISDTVVREEIGKKQKILQWWRVSSLEASFGSRSLEEKPYKRMLVVSTHLKNISQIVKLDHFPKVWGENKKCYKTW